MLSRASARPLVHITPGMFPPSLFVWEDSSIYPHPRKTSTIYSPGCSRNEACDSVIPVCTANPGLAAECRGDPCKCLQHHSCARSTSLRGKQEVVAAAKRRSQTRTRRL